MVGIRTRQNTSGFTIVELLIVIVVIAILAAITVVGFRGVQEQAKNSRLLAAMDSYEKILRGYKSEHGQYPRTESIPDAGPESSSTACLGEPGHYVANEHFRAGFCSTNELFEWPNYSTQDSLNVLLKSQLGSNTLPKVGDISAGTPFLGTPVSRGLTYTPERGLYAYPWATAAMSYIMDGDQRCGRGEKTLVPKPGDPSISVTMCTVKLD